MSDNENSDNTSGRGESSGGSVVGTALTFLLIGIGTGALVALLYAPKLGKQTRKELRRRYKDAREVFDDWSDDARDVAEDAVARGRKMANEFGDRVGPMAKNLRKNMGR